MALFLVAWAASARAADMSGALSVVARDPLTDELGVAVLSHAAACGNVVPWVQAGVGAIATQGETNVSWGPRGLQMLREGKTVQSMVDTLMHSDDGFQRRQLGALDKKGWPAGYSGVELVNWSGGILDSNLAVQGNTMPDNHVIEMVVDTMRATRGQPLADRLLTALALASANKADWRGARSAALLIGRANPARPEDASRWVYLRVDDDADPVGRLMQLYRDWRAGRLVASYLDYAKWYRESRSPVRADVEQARAQAAVAAALADSNLGAPALNAMAWQLARRGAMLEQAWVAIERARRAEPKSTEFTDTAAEVRFRQGRMTDAIALLEEAHKAVPADEYIAARLKDFRNRWPAHSIEGPGSKKQKYRH
jgi:uncharacterized Ntn-hydrolase superfamily protein